MLTQPILEKLRQMKLLGLAEAFSSQSQQVDVQGLSFEERFGLLVDQEWTYRQDRRLARLLKEARLRLPACPDRGCRGRPASGSTCPIRPIPPR
ncbi:MAG: ATP-binding protein [Bacillota bacterium]